MKEKPYQTGLFGILSHLADLMILNILWILCCVPVFTIGASTTALYTVTMKLLKGEGTPIVRTFFEAFRRNFKTATKTWLILLVPSVLVVGSAVTVLLNLWDGAPAVRILALAAAGIFWLAGNFVYPLTAYFDNSIGRTLLNALLMVFGDPVRALVIGAASLIPFGIYMADPSFFMGALIFWMIAGVGIIADLQSRLFLRIFARYVEPAEETTE